MIRPIMPPRVLLNKFDVGSTLGTPHDGATQKRVLQETLSLLGQDAQIEYGQFKAE